MDSKYLKYKKDAGELCCWSPLQCTLRQTLLIMFDNLRLTNFDLEGADLMSTKDSARDFII